MLHEHPEGWVWCATCQSRRPLRCVKQAETHPNRNLLLPSFVVVCLAAALRWLVLLYWLQTCHLKLMDHLFKLSFRISYPITTSTFSLTVTFLGGLVTRSSQTFTLTNTLCKTKVTAAHNCNRNPILSNIQGFKPLPNFRKAAQMSKNNPHKNQIAGVEGPP